MKVKLFDSEQNKDIEVEDSALPQMLSGNRFSVYPGQSFEFEDQAGQRKIVPSEQVFDAVDSGYKYIDSAKLQKEQALQEAEEKPILAAGIAGLSGLTLGISDYALKESGMFSEEELSNLREANPNISTAAEITGGLAPVLLSGGSSLGAKALAIAPAGIAERLGAKAATSALVGKALSKTTSEVAKQAIKVGVGSAVEGSLFGAGRLLSEDALGDAEFNAENLLSYAGMGALTGGALGGVTGGGLALGSKALKAGRDKLRQAEVSFINKNLEGEIKQNIINKIEINDKLDDYAELKGTTIDELQSKYDDAIEQENTDRIKKAAEELGVPLTEGMKTGGLIRELEGSLAKSKSFAGQLTSKEIEKTYKALEDVSNSFLKTAKEIDPFEVGYSAKAGITAKIEDELMPAKLMYQDLKPIMESTPLTESIKKRFMTERGKDFAARVAGDGEKWINKVKRLESIDDATKLRSLVREEMAGSKGTQREFLSSLYENLNTLRQNAIKYNLKGKPFVSKGKFAGDVSEALGLADNIYRETHKSHEFLKDQFNIRSSNMDEFLIKLKQDVTEEDIAKKILSLKDPETAKKFQDFFPEVYEMARSAKLSKIAKESTHEGRFSPKKFYTNVKELHNRELEILFPNIKNPKEVIKNFETVVNKLPPLTNPSGSAYELALQGMMSIGYQASEMARYIAYKKGAKVFQERLRKFAPDVAEEVQKGPSSIVSTTTGDAAVKMPVLEQIEKAANKGKISISDAVESYLKIAKTGARAGAKGIEKYITGKTLSDEEYKQAEEKAIQYSANPDQIIENFSKNNQQMLKSAPKTTEALSSAVVRASQFLASKAPRIKPSVFNDQAPSRSEVLKFKNYTDAVEKPFEAINAIASGYITPEAVEAMQVVYPKMFQSLKDEFSQRIPEFKKLSEKQKGDLSRLLELEDRPAFSFKGFQTLQGVSSQGVQKDLANNQANRSKIPVSASKNLGQSGRTQSGLDKVLNRS